jgi:hypothetical protein
MLLELLCVVTDVVPSGLVAHEFMKLVTNSGIIIQAVSCDGKGLLV